MQIPQLPKEARAELPGATDKVSKYRGTFVWWVIVASITILIISARLIHNMYEDRVTNLRNDNKAKDLKIENQEENIKVLYERLIIAQQQIAPRVEQLIDKTDTLGIKAEVIENNLGRTFKTIENAARKK